MKDFHPKMLLQQQKSLFFFNNSAFSWWIIRFFKAQHSETEINDWEEWKKLYFLFVSLGFLKSNLGCLGFFLLSLLWKRSNLFYSPPNLSYSAIFLNIPYLLSFRPGILGNTCWPLIRIFFLILYYYRIFFILFFYIYICFFF